MSRHSEDDNHAGEDKAKRRRIAAAERDARAATKLERAKRVRRQRRLNP